MNGSPAMMTTSSLILKIKWTTVLLITGFLFKGYCPIQVILVIKFFYTIENAKEMIRFFEKEGENHKSWFDKTNKADS